MPTSSFCESWERILQIQVAQAVGTILWIFKGIYNLYKNLETFPLLERSLCSKLQLLRKWCAARTSHGKIASPGIETDLFFSPSLKTWTNCARSLCEDPPVRPKQPLLSICWQILCKCCMFSHLMSWMPSAVLKIYLKLKIESKFVFCWQKCCTCFWDDVNSEQGRPSSEHLWSSLSNTCL